MHDTGQGGIGLESLTLGQARIQLSLVTWTFNLYDVKIYNACMRLGRIAITYVRRCSSSVSDRRTYWRTSWILAGRTDGLLMDAMHKTSHLGWAFAITQLACRHVRLHNERAQLSHGTSLDQVSFKMGQYEIKSGIPSWQCPQEEYAEVFTTYNAKNKTRYVPSL